MSDTDSTTAATCAGIYLLKQMDLKPEDGGMVFPIALPRELEVLDPIFEQLVLGGLVAMNKKSGRYELTPQGIDHIGNLIDEAEHYIDEFDDQPTQTVVRELRRRRLDPLRVRFLWGWYQGEFDDLVLWQQRRGLAEIETSWADYLTGPAFWAELAGELSAG